MNGEPLCGWSWHHKHRNDHTQAEIDSLAIEVSIDDRLQARARSGEKKDRGIIREIVKLNK